MPELIEDGLGGFLCGLEQVDEFAEKINLLADSPSLRRQMGEFNRQRIETSFTLETMVQNYKDLFTEVLDRGL
jgi:glycosyltransferase involved in cell wall biosynthesis